jgi:hypothetical protein
MSLVGVLDTSGPGGTIGPAFATSPSGAFLSLEGPGSMCTAAAPAYLPTGELVAEAECAPGGQWEAPRIVVLDPVTLQIKRTLFQSPLGHSAKWMAFDRTGRHAIVAVEIDEGRSSSGSALLYRWDGAGEPQRVPQSRYRIAW